MRPLGGKAFPSPRPGPVVFAPFPPVSLPFQLCVLPSKSSNPSFHLSCCSLSISMGVPRAMARPLFATPVTYLPLQWLRTPHSNLQPSFSDDH